MAMFVVLASKNIVSGRNNVLERHIGSELPKLTNEEVIELQADCDELDYIVEHMQDIPLAWQRDTVNGTKGKIFKPVQRWFGDHAKFIYHNLRW